MSGPYEGVEGIADMAERGAIILCGGESRRMGRDKAWLPFGGVTMLERVLAVIDSTVGKRVLVTRPGRSLPGDPPVIYDHPKGEGPLAGLVAGLEALGTPRAFVTACDVPLLRPSFIDRMFELAEGYEVAVPFVDGHHMVLSGVYSKSLLPRAKALLAAGRLRPFYLLEQAKVRLVRADELAEVDPDLESLRDCNTPETYASALEAAGLD